MSEKKDPVKKMQDHLESIAAIEHKGERIQALVDLGNRVRERERKVPVSFNDFLLMARDNPQMVFRDIFQLFHDMVHHYVPRGKDEYGASKDSVGFSNFDCSDLFVQGCDSPFFADRLFSNRLMGLINGFRKGIPHNQLFLFEGPPGSGKSTFLNNLLMRLEEYMKIAEGAMFKTYWRLDIKKLGGFRRIERRIDKLAEGVSKKEKLEGESELDSMRYPMKYFEFSCPKHDHPILQIPKEYRRRFLNEFIPDGEFKEHLFHRKEFEWVHKGIPCSICSSLFDTLLEILGDPMEVYSMIWARRDNYNRQFGEGISIFNPGDPTFKRPVTNSTIQTLINDLLKSNDVDYTYSVLAKTNNGVYALMDIKENNVERLKNLHGIISDGVHKVELVEERIRSLFVGVMNPEDKRHYEDVKSFQDRIVTVNVPYILDYNTEVAIYKNKFGKDITKLFLPGVLKNIARIIISTRLNRESPLIKEWISVPGRYSKYLDRDALLLKMDLYTGTIPSWLVEEDLKRFDKKRRKALLIEAETEGNAGISGRQSINVFKKLFTRYSKRGEAITMENVVKFFDRENDPLFELIPEGFLKSLEDMYDYNLVQEVKESIYFFNKEQIERDIKNYLCSVNFDIGDRVSCDHTNDVVEVTREYFKNFEMIILGNHATDTGMQEFRNDARREYISRTLTQEIRIEGKDITDTLLFKSIFEKYKNNLKENALAPYIGSDSFRLAVKDYGTKSFDAYDERLKRDIKRMIKNMKKKFGYSDSGASQVVLYVFDKKIMDRY